MNAATVRALRLAADTLEALPGAAPVSVHADDNGLTFSVQGKPHGQRVTVDALATLLHLPRPDVKVLLSSSFYGSGRFVGDLYIQVHALIPQEATA